MYKALPNENHSDVMKPIAAPIVGGMSTSTIQVLILVPVFFALMKERGFVAALCKPEKPKQEHKTFCSQFRLIPKA